MLLKDLLRDVEIEKLRASDAVEVSAICQDSRTFTTGQLFIAIRGEKFDGHNFIPEACARGASAVIVESGRVQNLKNLIPQNFAGAVVEVSDTRRALDQIAANFYGRPSEKIFVVGVTGTNGKTTSSHMIEAVLNGATPTTGVIGTIDYHFKNHKLPSTHTTPDALNLQHLLKTWVDDGMKSLTIEVSSHALKQGRVDSMAFDVAVFTNITRDHLDFHKTMDEYIAAKARLFHELLDKSPKTSKLALLNAEDPHYKKFLPLTKIPTWTFGRNTGNIQATHIQLSFDKTQFDVKTPLGDFPVTLQMIGSHNVLNALAAIGVGLHKGLNPKDIQGALAKLTGVKGRLERVVSPSPVRVFVDYAHSDDALKNVLSFLKSLRDETSPDSRIITVFGCGGDRDKGKRPLMLKAAQGLSDRVVITSDNPRTEDPNQIIADILAAQPSRPGPNILVEVDRKSAIKLAINNASPGDVVLIAGKGHEDYQIIGTKKFPFDDVVVAKEILDK